MSEIIFKILGLICGFFFTIWFVAAMVKYTLDFIDDVICRCDWIKKNLEDLKK